MFTSVSLLMSNHFYQRLTSYIQFFRHECYYLYPKLVQTVKGDFYSLRLHDAYCILIFLGTFDFAKIHSLSILNDKQTDLHKLSTKIKLIFSA